MTARNVADWEADCIICGLSTLDADHILILGYAPPDEAEIGEDLCLTWAVDHGVVVIDEPYSTQSTHPSNLSSNPHYDHHHDTPIKVTATQPEMQVVVRATGEVTPPP